MPNYLQLLRDMSSNKPTDIDPEGLADYVEMLEKAILHVNTHLYQNDNDEWCFHQPFKENLFKKAVDTLTK